MRRQSKLRLGLLLLLGAIVFEIACEKSSGTKPKPPSGPVACAGQTCLSFLKTPAAFCKTLSTGKQNEAFFARPGGNYVVPITVYYQTIPTDPNGLDQPAEPPTPQPFKVPGGGAQFPVCEAAVVGGEIYSQRLVVSCETNRSISTGGSCTGNEIINPPLAVYPFLTRYDKAIIAAKQKKGEDVLKQFQTESSSRTWAPSALSPTDASVNCTAVCNAGSIGNAACLPVSSASLNSAMFNFVSTWRPGSPVSMSEATRAIGTQNKCQRSEDIISASNASKNLISNTGDECSVVGSFAGDDVQFIVPKEISGKVEEMPYGKQISFDNAHQPSVMFPTYLDKFNGEISEMAIPNGTAFVDIRVPLSCIRVDAH